MDIVGDDLHNWNASAIDSFEDCKQFYERTYDGLATTDAYAADRDRRFLSSDAIGSWVAWNLLGRQPNDDADHRLARSIGVQVTASFADW